MTIYELIAGALVRYPFRPPREGESLEAYRAALVEFLESRDFALGHEIRVGRAQADWTPEDVKAFRENIEREHYRGPGRDVEALEMLGTESGEWEPTDASMWVIFNELLSMMRDWKIEDPGRVLFPHIAALMTNGQLFSAPVERRDRKGALRMLTKHGPCYGWVVVADAFMHLITEDKTATKQDVILGHMGTRTTRVIKNLLYRYVDGRPVFDPTPQEWDLRNMPPGEQIEDPYADLLVSVPRSERVS